MMILVVYCACCFLSLETEIQFLCVITCLNNMQIVSENDVNICMLVIY